MKLKSTCEVDAVVGGFTAPRGAGRFGALLLGLYDGPNLRYIGGCGSGFNEKLQEQIWAQLEKLVTSESPFSEKPQTREKATWVKPSLVARVKFTEWTRDKHLRAPVFLGLRTDVEPRECVMPEAAAAPAPEPAGALETELCRSTAENVTAEVEGQRLKFTHLKKLYFPEEGLTKRDLLCYYLRIAPLILPFLRDRPLVLRRMPEGMRGQLFYQKDAGEFAAEWMPTVPVDGVRYFMANDLAGLLYLTNLGCIDHNPWASRVDDLTHPDYLFVDLDPTDETPYSTVVAVARAVHDVLTRNRAQSVSEDFRRERAAHLRAARTHVRFRAGRPFHGNRRASGSRARARQGDLRTHRGKESAQPRAARLLATLVLAAARLGLQRAPDAEGLRLRAHHAR